MQMLLQMNKQKIKAYEKGFKQQKDNVDNFVANFNDASISGVAFSKGARAAFVSNFKTDAENKLNDFAIKHQYQPEKYKEKFEVYKEKSLANVPVSFITRHFKLVRWNWW